MTTRGESRSSAAVAAGALGAPTPAAPQLERQPPIEADRSALAREACEARADPRDARRRHAGVGVMVLQAAPPNGPGDPPPRARVAQAIQDRDATIDCAHARPAAHPVAGLHPRRASTARRAARARRQAAGRADHRGRPRRLPPASIARRHRIRRLTNAPARRPAQRRRRRRALKLRCSTTAAARGRGRPAGLLGCASARPSTAASSPPVSDRAAARSARLPLPGGS